MITWQSVVPGLAGRSPSLTAAKRRRSSSLPALHHVLAGSLPGGGLPAVRIDGRGLASLDKSKPQEEKVTTLLELIEAARAPAG